MNAMKNFDEQIDKTLNAFYGIPAGFSTDEFYREYVRICEADGVKPKVKSYVVKEVCKGTGLEIRVEVIRKKYFKEKKK